MAYCGKCLHKEVCVDYRYYKPIAEKCQHFKEFNVDKKLQANADRIRAMNDEELAKHLVDIGWDCHLCAEHRRLDNEPFLRGEKCDEKCEEHCLEWLQQPSK